MVNFSHGKETEAENAGILCKLDKYASSDVAIIYFYLLTSSPRTLRPVNHSDWHPSTHTLPCCRCSPPLVLVCVVDF